MNTMFLEEINSNLNIIYCIVSVYSDCKDILKII